MIGSSKCTFLLLHNLSFVFFKKLMYTNTRRVFMKNNKQEIILSQEVASVDKFWNMIKKKHLSSMHLFK